MEAERITTTPVFQSPQQKLASFAAHWPHDKVNDLLWEIFRLAVKGGLGEEMCVITAKEVALLFDQLIDLSAAMAQEGGATFISETIGEEDTHA